MRAAALTALMAMLVLALSGANPALGTSFVVNATHDAVDETPGDGICDDGTGACTLRAAVMEANALPGPDEIGVSAGTYTLSLTGTGENAAATGDLDITDDLAVTAEGPSTVTVDAGGIDRVFHLLSGASTVSISGLTISGGDTDASTASTCFLNIYGGGGICSASGNLTLMDTVISGNHAEGPGGGIAAGQSSRLELSASEVSGNSSGILGGGVFNFGGASIRDTAVRGNSANAGGGIGNTRDQPNDARFLEIEDSVIEDNEATLGGGVNNGFRAEMRIRRTTITGNTGSHGGGVHNTGGIDFGEIFVPPAVMTLEDSTVQGNNGAIGGGVFNGTGDYPAELTVRRSTIADNSSSVNAGGMHNAGVLTLTESTISGNTAVFGGGGLLNTAPQELPNRFGQATLHNSTISGNSGGANGGGVSNGGALTVTSVTIARNSAIIGGNIARLGADNVIAGNTIVGEAQSGGDCSGPPLSSLGHNLDSDGTCGLTGPGDLSNVDPLLGPLGNYGAPTQTHELQAGTSCPCGDNLPGSPAIDAGDAALCTATDQRGIPRPFDGNGDGVALCDIGAHENDHGVAVCGCPASPTATPGTGATPEPSPTAALPSALPATGGAAESTRDPRLMIVISAVMSATIGFAIRRMFTHR